MAETKETVVKEVDVLYETAQAWRVIFIDDLQKTKHWVPKSQCEIYDKGMQQMLSIPTWLYEKKMNGED